MTQRLPPTTPCLPGAPAGHGLHAAAGRRPDRHHAAVRRHRGRRARPQAARRPRATQGASTAATPKASRMPSYAPHSANYTASPLPLPLPSLQLLLLLLLLLAALSATVPPLLLASTLRRWGSMGF